MFGIGKKKTSTPAIKPDIDPKIDEQIHVMPERFYVAQKKNRLAPALLLGGGAVVVIGLAGFAFYLNESLRNASRVPVNQTVNTTPVNQNSNQAPVVLTNTPPTNQSVATQTPTSTTPLPLPTPTPVNPDSDNDTLSATEENLYGTNPSLYDTDSDGYGDGAELASGYDPLQKNAPLSGAGLFETYSNVSYSISHPVAWNSRSQDGDNQIIFTASTGESVSIVKVPNPNKLSLLAWLTDQFPSTQPSSFTQVSINGALGYRHADGLSYYLAGRATPETVYIVVYTNSTTGAPNFLTTFNLMVKSFTLR